MKNELEIIDFKDEHDNRALELFYLTVFHNRKEFEYARHPTWSHRYSLEKHTIKKLALLDGKIVGSLGLISYNGYVNGKKQKIGFFVDNCIIPEHNHQYEKIMEKLFERVEKQAKKEGVQIMLGWEYELHSNTHSQMYTRMGYSRIDGINWFGGGTAHSGMISIEGFNLPFIWRVGLRLLALKHHFKEAMLAPLKHEHIRTMVEKDVPGIVKLINAHNEKLEFSPRYTSTSLKEVITKYNAKGLVVEIDGRIEGTLISFFAPWSGWMYGKPVYQKSHGLFLIKHPLEFVVSPKNAERVGVHLLFHAMKSEKQGVHVMFVDLFDRRVEWMKKAYLDTGADELPYDYGTAFFKSLSGKKIIPKKPLYMPTNLVISPYTAKDY